jgi:GGDEF domain-containing protein
MRRKVQASRTALGDFAAEVSACNTTHQGGVREQIETLNAAAQTVELDRVRHVIGQACAGIRRSHEELARGQRIAMVQLQDEIRTLRDTIETHKRERDRDPESGAWRREYIDAEIRLRLARMESFSVLLVSVFDLANLRREYAGEAVQRLFEALIKRLAAVVGNEATIGRWNATAFALLVPATGEAAGAIRDRICVRLPGAYSVQNGGRALTLRVDVSVTVLDPRPGAEVPGP